MEPKDILVVLILMLVALAAGWVTGQRMTDTRWQSRWSQRDAADITARAEQEARNRAAEYTMQHSVAKVSQNAEQQLRAAQADAVRAGTAAERLRGTVSELQRRLRESESTVGAALAGKREAEARAGILLADLFSESVERNRQLAAAADDARIRGLACEAVYSAVQEKPNDDEAESKT